MSTDQGEVLCGREGNRRSGVALFMRHRLRGTSTHGLNGLRNEDKHLDYTPSRSWQPFYRYQLAVMASLHHFDLNLGKIGRGSKTFVRERCLLRLTDTPIFPNHTMSSLDLHYENA